eukprot:scaffold207709_cov30-Tisochrysis_lutea.AAC.2
MPSSAHTRFRSQRDFRDCPRAFANAFMGSGARPMTLFSKTIKDGYICIWRKRAEKCAEHAVDQVEVWFCPQPPRRN